MYGTPADGMQQTAQDGNVYERHALCIALRCLRLCCAAAERRALSAPVPLRSLSLSSWIVAWTAPHGSCYRGTMPTAMLCRGGVPTLWAVKMPLSAPHSQDGAGSGRAERDGVAYALHGSRALVRRVRTEPAERFLSGTAGSTELSDRSWKLQMLAC